MVAAAHAQSRTVALTFDDLPGDDSLPRASEASRAGRDADVLAQTNIAILQALDRHHAKAIGFVIGERVEAGRALLQTWIDRGHDLGNHSYTHRDLNDLTVQAFADEVARSE